MVWLIHNNNTLCKKVFLDRYIWIDCNNYLWSMMVKNMAAVVAAAVPNRGIGYQGNMPWKLPADMKHFQRLTTEVSEPGKVNAVIMGRKTWESIPSKFRPLAGRTNVVMTRQTNQDYPDSVLVASSFQDAHEQLEAKVGSALESVFVMGGAEIYKQAIEQGWVTKVIYTEITNLPDGTVFDTYFPELDESQWTTKPFRAAVASVENDKENSALSNSQSEEKPDDNGINNKFQVDPKSGVQYRFVEYNKAEEPKQSLSEATTTNLEELQYLDACRQILEKGVRRGDRTGTGTLSVFGTQMRFSLRDGRLPLLTTKRTFWRGVAEELLWFISGSTNANELAAKDIHIWDGNGSREFLDSRGLGHREVGDLGPVYGFQWRHFGAEYVDMHTDYTGQGVDQLADCIHKIIHTPEDRRIVMSAWNPSDLGVMALPPCHMFCQFYVDTEKNEVSCQMYQRSADMGLGVPFNIASYALLTHLVAHVTGRKPGDFVHCIGDAHIYLNHIDALKEQLTRAPRDFPTLEINPEKKDIDAFSYDDLKVIGYNPHKAIKMKMAV